MLISIVINFKYNFFPSNLLLVPKFPKPHRYQLLWRPSAITPNVVKRVLRRSNFRITLSMNLFLNEKNILPNVDTVFLKKLIYSEMDVPKSVYLIRQSVNLLKIKIFTCLKHIILSS